MAVQNVAVWMSGERITWYLEGDAQAGVTEEADGSWSWYWSPAGSRPGKSRTGFPGRDDAIAAVRAALGEAGIILNRKIGERTCRNCHRPLFDHWPFRCCPGWCPGTERVGRMFG